MNNISRVPQNLICGKVDAKYCDHINSMFVCTVVAVNHTALICLDRALVALSKSKYFRHRIKRAVHNLTDMKKVYRERIFMLMECNRYGNRRQFLEDYLRENYDFVRKDVEMFRMQVNAAMKKNRYSESELLTEISVAFVMLDFAQQLYKSFWEDAYKDAGMRYNHIFSYADFSAFYNEYFKIIELMDPERKVDFNNDKNCHLAFDILSKKMMSNDIINKAGSTALDFNEDVKKWAEEREKQ